MENFVRTRRFSPAVTRDPVVRGLWRLFRKFEPDQAIALVVPSNLFNGG